MQCSFGRRSSALVKSGSRDGNDARTFDDYRDFSVGGVADADACANSRHLGRQLQYYGPGKRVQAPSVQTPSVQTPSVQTGAAGTMACTEIQITTWDGEASAYSQIENRKSAEWKHTVVCLRSTDGADVSKLANRAWRGPGRRRDLSGSSRTLHAPGWCVRTERRRQGRIYGLLSLTPLPPTQFLTGVVHPSAIVAKIFGWTL